MTKAWKIAIIVAIGMFVAYVAYATVQQRAQHAGQDRLQVLTTFTVLADMARNVAGDVADVQSLTKPGAEIHGYEPTPADIVRLSKADLVLDNGMNLEVWASKLYTNVPDVPHVTLTDDITPIGIAEGPYKDKPNPHAWMSPANALKYVDAIEAALSEHDARNTATYKANASAYKQKIQALDSKLRQELKDIDTGERYLVTCEGAFTYLTRDYGLEELYLWPINADAQGTPQQIRRVIESVKTHDVPTVYCESTVNDKAQRQVAQETGARFGGKFYVDSLSGSDGPTPTYLKLLGYNVDLFLEGLE